MTGVIDAILGKHAAKVAGGILALIISGSAAVAAVATSGSESSEVDTITEQKKSENRNVGDKPSLKKISVDSPVALSHIGNGSTSKKIPDNNTLIKEELNNAFNELKNKRHKLQSEIEKLSGSLRSHLQNLNNIKFWIQNIEKCETKTPTYQRKDMSQEANHLLGQVELSKQVKQNADKLLHQDYKRTLDEKSDAAEKNKDIPTHFQPKIKEFEEGINKMEGSWKSLNGEETLKNLKSSTGNMISTLKKEDDRCSFKDLIRTNDWIGQQMKNK